jgi:hypothetical protein
MLTKMTHEVTTQARMVLDALAVTLDIPIGRATLGTLFQRANLGESIGFEDDSLSVKFTRNEGSPDKQTYQLLIRHGAGATATTVIQLSIRGAATSDDPFAWAKLESAAKRMNEGIEQRARRAPAKGG